MSNRVLSLSRETASYLIESYSEFFTARSYKGGRLPTSIETQLLVFLWFSGNKTSIREVSTTFCISYSNVHKILNNVLNFLDSGMAPEVIRFPSSNEEKEAIANEFKKVSGIPNILGCIDGSYICARTPKNTARSTYNNKHVGVSITLQGICDCRLRFLDVFTGVPSKIHDSNVLKMSPVGKELQILCANKYYLLGDSAYPLREYLLKPYKNNENLSESEENFNTQFYRTHVKIEKAFCLLKNRFRQLMRLDFHNVETMTKFVTACCVLHNICIDRDEDFQEEISNTEHNNTAYYPPETDRREILLTQLGEIKRDEVKDILLH